MQGINLLHSKKINFVSQKVVLKKLDLLILEAISSKIFVL
jgi:hypothetical protein